MVKALSAKIDALVKEYDNRLTCMDGTTARTIEVRELFISDVWPRVEGDFKRMLELLKQFIQQRLDANNLPGKVEVRAKEARSIASTLVRREKEFDIHCHSIRHVFEQMHDLAGCRIVLQSVDDQERGVELVKTEFCSKKLHVGITGKGGSLWPVRFGAYRSSNHRVGLGAEAADALTRNYKDVMFEIQVTDWIQNTWNKYAHKILYKGQFGEPCRVTQQLVDLLKGSLTSLDVVLNSIHDVLRASKQRFAGVGPNHQAAIAANSALEVLGPEMRNAVQEVIKECVQSVENESFALPKIQGLQYCRDLKKQQTEVMSAFVHELRQEILCNRFAARRKAMIQRLSSISSSRDAKDMISAPEPGTGEWFKNHPSYKTWLTSKSSSLLWVSTEAGCGKSVLAKQLVDKLLPLPGSDSRVVCYYFFRDDLDNSKAAPSALRTMLHQIFDQREDLLTNDLLEHLENAGDTMSESYGLLWNSLVSVAEQENGPEVVCVLDALDECASKGRDMITKSLREYYGPTDNSDGGSGQNNYAPQLGRLKILLTSRPEESIKRQLRFMTSTIGPQNRHVCLHLQGEGDEWIQLIEKDIKIVIEKIVLELTEDLSLTTEQEQALRLKLSENRNLTYLWVKLMHDYLANQDDILTPGAFDQSLQTLPVEVDEAYEKILHRRPNPSQTNNVLRILLAAYWPLSLQEFAIAWAVNFTTPRPEWLQQRIPPFALQDVKPASEEQARNHIKRHCGSLVIIVDNKVSFLHHTVKEFLVCLPSLTIMSTDCMVQSWKRSIDLDEVHHDFLNICVKYLASIPYGNHWNISFEEVVGIFPFFFYSAQLWQFHWEQCARRELFQATIKDYMLSLQHKGVNRRFWHVLRYRVTRY
ncbi:hypothetical protein MCOR25_005070 [Pyricularia grisea]|nr:hypothetical protein MCOR25_005070 [Pyricularia grisea]